MIAAIRSFRARCTASLLASCLLVAPAAAQRNAAQRNAAVEPSPAELRTDRATTYRYRAGVVVKMGAGSCRSLFGTMPIPSNWPEQQVEIVDQEITPNAEVSYVELDGAYHMQVRGRNLAPGDELKAILELDVTRYELTTPEAPLELAAPRRAGRELKPYLGTSPFIEVSNGRVRSAAREAIGDEKSQWRQAEMIYDWTREHVQYVEGDLKGAAAALRDGNGDCEELTSVFIAICRKNRIPARTVWVPGHCYPEFYLEDAAGNGRWYPCQAAGDRAFGALLERPILQKGDSFHLPWKRTAVRYAAEHLEVEGATVKPKVTFVRDLEQNDAY